MFETQYVYIYIYIYVCQKIKHYIQSLASFIDKLGIPVSESITHSETKFLFVLLLLNVEWFQSSDFYLSPLKH